MTPAPPPEFRVPDGKILTEDAAALQFARLYKGKLAYCHDQGAWFEFDGSIWREQRTRLAFHFARELSRQMSEWAPSPAQFQKSAFVNGVEKFSQNDPIFSRTSDTWNIDPWLLGTPTGTVDLRTGRHRPSIAGDHITRSVAVPPAEWAECPIWLDFLKDSTGGDDELIRFLQQMAGYALTADTREDALFFIYGPGGNGKSVFLSALNGILGDYAITAAMSTFEASKGGQVPADLAMLRGSRLVTASETEEGKPWAEARIKAMTGGDPITARFMRQNFFTFRPQFKIVVVGNHKPVLKVVDEAMKRRFNIIPFVIKPEKPDRQLDEKLRKEWPAILRWMIDGCLDWQENGLVRPSLVTAATEEYFEDQDMFSQWCAEHCDVDKPARHMLEMSSVLFRSWAAFAKASGEEPGSIKSFAQTLQREGFRKKQTNQGAFYEGIRIRGSATSGDD